MKRIEVDISRYTKPTTKARNAREELVEKFLQRLNPGRIKAGYNPYDEPRLNRMLKAAGYGAGVDLYPLYRECENANHFGKLFEWKMRQKRDNAPTY